MYTNFFLMRRYLNFYRNNFIFLFKKSFLLNQENSNKLSELHGVIIAFGVENWHNVSWSNSISYKSVSSMWSTNCTRYFGDLFDYSFCSLNVSRKLLESRYYCNRNDCWIYCCFWKHFSLIVPIMKILWHFLSYSHLYNPLH